MITTYDSGIFKILVSLDSILETHLGTAALLDPKSPAEILDNGYYNRDSYDFWEFTDKFTEDQFKSKWECRDIDTLKCSVVRNVFKFIKNMTHAKMLDDSDRGGDLEVKVIINGFPYTINNRLERYLSELLLGLFSTIVTITFVSLHIKEITPTYLKTENINSLFLIDFNDWFKIHYQELDKTPYPKLEVYAPAISKNIFERINRAIERGEIDKDIARKINPFKANEISLAEHLSLNYLPVDIFSIPII